MFRAETQNRYYVTSIAFKIRLDIEARGFVGITAWLDLHFFKQKLRGRHIFV